MCDINICDRDLTENKQICTAQGMQFTACRGLTAYLHGNMTNK